MEVGVQHTKFSIVPEKKRKPRGCLFYGCLSVVVVVLLGVIGLYFGFRYAASSFVEKYSAATGLVIPAPTVSHDKFPALEAELTSFVDAARKGTATKPLILDSDALNALVTFHPKLAPLAGRVHCNIQGDKLNAKMSVPLDAYGYPGKFLNGEASIKAVLEYGLLKITLDQLSMNGIAAPDPILEELRKDNLGQALMQDVEIQAALDRLQSIVIKDGKIVVTAK